MVGSASRDALKKRESLAGLRSTANNALSVCLLFPSGWSDDFIVFYHQQDIQRKLERRRSRDAFLHNIQYDPFGEGDVRTA